MALSKPLRRTLFIAGFGLLAGLAGFGLGRLLQHGATSVATVTDFKLQDLAGRPHSLADWQGKLVLLNFWATWCPPCRAEIPLFLDVQRRYAGRGLQIVGISVDHPEAVARFWQEMGIDYPLLIADENTFELMVAYGNRSNGLPYSVLIGPDGAIVATKLGPYHRAELEALIEPHLPGSTPAGG
jgi:thiol-disulfide isomerase/thioredoxin